MSYGAFIWPKIFGPMKSAGSGGRFKSPRNQDAGADGLARSARTDAQNAKETG